MSTPIRSNRWPFALIPILLAFVLVIPGMNLALFALRPSASLIKTESPLIISRGAGPGEVARQLQEAKIISDPKKFVLLGKVLRKWKKLKTGEYLFSSTMTPLEIFKTLASGVSIRHPVTIREGQNMFEAAQAFEAAGLIQQKDFLVLCRKASFIRDLGFQGPIPQTLEGYLFPDTYFFTKFESAEEMIKTLVKKYRAVWTQIQSRYQRELQNLGLTEHEVLTLASIIEKETGAPEERPLISSVFHNRLKKKMRLQSDPTTIYGIWEIYKGDIRRQDLLTPTPFNTYTIPGLPAGPISNPGILAIEATIKPAASGYLFFVSQNEGRHIFTTSYQEHSQAVKKFQLDPKARAGKSWRNLNLKVNESSR